MWLQLHLGRELVRVINPLEPLKEGSGGEVTANEPSYALLELGVCVWTPCGLSLYHSQLIYHSALAFINKCTTLKSKIIRQRHAQKS